MVRPEIEPRMVFLDLVADFVAPLVAILLPLLAVVDAVGPIGREVATSIRAIVDAIRAIVGTTCAIVDAYPAAISRQVGAVVDRWTTADSRTLADGRTAFGTAVLEELGSGAAGNSGADCGAEIRPAWP